MIACHCQKSRACLLMEMVRTGMVPPRYPGAACLIAGVREERKRMRPVDQIAQGRNRR